MPAAADERERAVAEVAQVYERIKIQQPLLLHHQYYSSHQLMAHTLLCDALRALNLALSVMKQPSTTAPATTPPISITSVVVKAEPRALSPPSPASADSEAIATTTERRAKKRRSSVMEAKTTSSSWVDFTTVPYEDGYEWRKYGEKKINGTTYTRSYFRCTYKDDTACLATKHVQQKDSSDPPLFQVTYNNKHTCNTGCTTATTVANSSKRVMINNPLNDHAAINIKLEPPVLLPPTLAVDAYSALLLPFDQTMPPSQQEPSFPVSIQQQQPCGTATSTTSSSCISGESCDEYPAGDMAAAEASPGYDLLYEELSLLCDSFKFY
ncbi:unnamed protein product [Urochloa humidicola]